MHSAKRLHLYDNFPFHEPFFKLFGTVHSERYGVDDNSQVLWAFLFALKYIRIGCIEFIP